MNHRRTTRTRSDCQGFTLMELLIATLVAAIVLSAMNTAFYAAMHLRLSTTALVETSIPLNRSTSILKTDLRNVLVTETMAASFESPGTVIGNNVPSLLDIYTTSGVLHNDLPWGDVQRISYYLKNSSGLSRSGGRDLIRAVTRNLLATLQPDVTEQVVLSDVSSLDFSFYDGANWQTTWDSTTAATPIPQAVKVEIQFANGSSDKQALLPIEMVVLLDNQSTTNGTTSAATSGGGA